MTAYVDPTKETFAAFKEMTRAGPVHMLNLLRFRETAAYDDGTVATGLEAYRSYARESGPIFQALGGRIVWSGDFQLTLTGPADEAWDLCFIAEYPSAEAFIGMIRDPDYKKAVRHRTAAVKTSRLIRLTPREAGGMFG